MDWKRTRYIGAYGVCLHDEQLLVIQKARGPYTGTYDLPGGGIEHGESPEATVLREFVEETGLTVEVGLLLGTYSKVSRYVTAAGLPEEVHHLGFIYRVTLVEGVLKLDPDGLDSLGARWLALPATLPLSPLAETGARLAMR